MEVNETLKAQMMQIIQNQIKANNPAEVRKTLERLKGLGYSGEDAKKLIGQCLVRELFDVLKHQKPFDEPRYVRNLKKLPESPSEDE
jgi:hypothetical protein